MQTYTVKGSLDGKPQTLKIKAADSTNAKLEAEVQLRKLAARRGNFDPRIKIVSSTINK